VCILWAWYLVICEQPETRPLQPISLAASPESLTLALYSSQIASRSLGIGESALRRWVDQVQKERQGVTPQRKAQTPEQQKNQELEARIESHTTHHFWRFRKSGRPTQVRISGFFFAL